MATFRRERLLMNSVLPTFPEKLFPLGNYLHPWQRFTSVQQVLDYPMPTFDPAGVAEKVKRLKDRGYAVSAPRAAFRNGCTACVEWRNCLWIWLTILTWPNRYSTASRLWMSSLPWADRGGRGYHLLSMMTRPRKKAC